MADLGAHLRSAVSTQTKTAIVEGLWVPNAASRLRSTDLNWDAYFAYYTKQCIEALYPDGKNVAARQHRDILTFAQFFKDGLTREQVGDRIRGTFSPGKSQQEKDQMADGTIIISVRLLAMIHLGTLPAEVSAKLPLPWDKGSLHEAIHSWFNERPTVDHDNVVIDKNLTARDIDRSSKIEVILTDNLLDHLRLTNENKTLWIFHHVAFLKWMKVTKNNMYPDGFIEETLNTLTLLFPENDRKAKIWLKKNPRWVEMDQGLLKMGHFEPGDSFRRLEHYTFWRDRLDSLVEAVEDAGIWTAVYRNLSNNEKGERWFESWVAVVAIALALFFGLVQSIEGAIQVYKAYHPAT